MVRIFNGVLFLLSCLIISAVLFGLSRPYVQAQKMRRENDRLEVAVNQQAIRLAGYRNGLKMWSTPEGVEFTSRRYGWIKPGEQRLRIIPH
jgi:type III secretory pathway component EscR